MLLMNNNILFILVTMGLIFFGINGPLNLSASSSKAQVKSNIEREYDADVLKILNGTVNGKSVFYVTVMFRGGNYNTAYQINTLVFDVSTGRILPQFRHHSSGRSLSGAYDNKPNRQSMEALRGHVWR